MTATAVCYDEPQAYMPVFELQKRLVKARIAEKIPDIVLLLEHKPVVTLGRRGRDECLCLPPEEYARRDIEVVQSSRGGDVTYHGPGQLVIYPIIKLGGRDADTHGYLHNLEEVAIRTAASFDVEAYRREGMSGAWTSRGKIAAIGFKVSRWVTSHGMSLNISSSLSGFDTIIPCGLAGEGVASFQTILGAEGPSVLDVRQAMISHFGKVCDRELTVFNATSPPAFLREYI